MENGKLKIESLQFSIFNYQFSIVVAILLSLGSCSGNKHAEHPNGDFG
jgi:hypothetical protein